MDEQGVDQIEKLHEENQCLLNNQFRETNMLRMPKEVARLTENQSKTIMKRKQKTKSKAISKSSPLKKKESSDRSPDNESNPLKKVIQYMIDVGFNVDLIPTLPKDLIKEILAMLGIGYFLRIHKTALERLIMDVDICYLIELLRKWKGWMILKEVKYFSTDESYDVLFFHLNTNFSEFILDRDRCVEDELDNQFNLENYVNITCSLRYLQSLFRFGPEECVQGKELLPKYIILWPHVSTRINLLYFSMTHQNNHYDEYRLLNALNELNIISYKKKNTNLFVRKASDRSDSEKFSRNNIAAFLRQLKKAIVNRLGKNISWKILGNILMALSTMEKDIAHCPNVIESNSKYNKRLAPHSYYRYIGCSANADNTPVPEQSDSNLSMSNVKLHQTRQPKASFVLESFNVSYEIGHVLNDLIDKLKENKYISYRCMLCNEAWETSIPTQMSDHFLKYHGHEPDWKCVKCAQSLTNEYLIKNDWYHLCK